MLEFTQTKTTNTERRFIKTSYVIPSTEQQDAQGRTSVAVLEVTTGHSSGGKSFSSTINRTRVSHDNGFTVSSYDLFEPKPLQRMDTKVARYSMKAMEQEHTDYLSTVGPWLSTTLDWAAAKEIDN
jgi:hypothetical protein